MTESPNPGNEPTPSPRPPHRFRRFRRVAIPVGITLLAGTGGVAVWGWKFIHDDLPPLVAETLSKTLDRPVRVGRVERVSLTGLRLGASSLPATKTDPATASVQAVEVSFNLLQTLFTRKLKLDVTLVKPDVYLEQEKTGWLKTTIKQQEDQEGWIEVGTIQLEDGSVELVPLKPIGKTRSPVHLADVNGKADIFDKNKRFDYELTARSLTGGNLHLTGETQLPSQDSRLNVRAQNFQVAEIDRLLNLPFNLPTGTGGGNLTVNYNPKNPLPTLNGTAQFNRVTLAIPQAPTPFTKASGGLRFQGSTIQLDQVNAFYGKAALIANGSVDLTKDNPNAFNLSAQVKPTYLPDLLKTLNVTLPFATAGQIAAQVKVTGALQTPVLSGIAQNTQPGKFDQIDLSRYGATFKLDTGAQDIVVQSIQATPTAGGQVTGSGRINLASKDSAGKIRPEIALSFLALNVPGDPIARVYNQGNALPVTVGRVDAQAQISGTADNVRTFVRWQAPGATYPGTGEIVVANGVTTLRNTLFKVAGGTLTASAVATNTPNGRWQALVDGTGIALSQISPDLRGLFNGKFIAFGTLKSFKPSDIRAQGQARLSQGISVINDPLTAQVQWNGQALLVQQATAPGFSANGIVNARLEGTPAITGLDLNVRLSDYDLQAFKVPVPDTIRYAGRTDFAGRITGTPTAPTVAGNVALKRFVVNGLAFDPLMQGRLRYGQTGVALDLNGQASRDRIALQTDSTFQPLGFELRQDYLRQDDIYARGETRGGILYATVQNVPLSLAQAAGFSSQYAPSGKLSSVGLLAINWAQKSVEGNIKIDQPGLGGYLADSFTGRISLMNGVAKLTGGALNFVTKGFGNQQQITTVLKIDGAVTNLLSGNPQLKAQINIPKGELGDVLKSLQIFDIQDLQRGLTAPTYGTAANLETVPVDLTRVPVQDQLRRLSEVKTLLGKTVATRESAVLPELRDLTGQFAGNINVSGSLQRGIQADFSLHGENFRWGNRFVAKQVVAIGSFENGALTLLPLRLQSDAAIVAFSGQVFGNKQSGQLRIENLPITTLTDIVALPIAADGLINATATLSGSFDNPQVLGSFNLAQGVLNGTALQSARGNFSYANARLDFTNTVAISATEPLYVIGSIPYQLPFGKVAPNSNQIRLDIDVKNEGLALLNIVTNQLAWIDGKGEVKLKVRGTIANPVAAGFVRVDNATLQARALPDPLTNVTGIARFNTDRVRVEALKGTFSKGSISASGVIPLANPLSESDPDIENPLTVALDKIRLNLKGLYQGGVDGNVVVTGTALTPRLGGNIRLSDGQVLLAQAAGGGGLPTSGSGADTGSAVEFEGLQLELGDRVALVAQPLLSFTAFGTLNINGGLNDIRPEGVISLRSGQVNLFTTQFTLERGYPQTAEFTPERKLDPVLDLRLIAVVPEVVSRRQPSVLSPSEILDVPVQASSLGALQTVRVKAVVQGPASQLLQNSANGISNQFSLTSSPPRSESEIVALIGGSFVDTLGRGDTLLGLANLAGSALLNNIQGVIGNALGLSEFRLYPTYVNNSRTRGSNANATLGLAAEAAVDITPALSASLSKIITNNQLPQFGLRYRLNDNILLRSSTDFSGDTRASVEYEARF